MVFEIREDNEGEVFHLVTLWKATKKRWSYMEENSQDREGGFCRRHCSDG